MIFHRVSNLILSTWGPKCHHGLADRIGLIQEQGDKWNPGSSPPHACPVGPWMQPMFIFLCHHDRRATASLSIKCTPDFKDLAQKRNVKYLINYLYIDYILK